MSAVDIEYLISGNYMAFALLFGLIIMMYAYRDVKLPASRTFVLIAVVLFTMCVSHSVEYWAMLSPSRHDARLVASTLHYVLQPFVIFLELIVLIPPDFNAFKKILFTIPIFFNTIVYLAAPFAGHLVFWYDENYNFCRGPLGATIYVVTFFYLVLLLYWSIRLFHTKNKRMSIVLFFVAGIAILTALLEGFNIAAGHIDEAFVLGVFLFYMYLVTVHEREVEESLIIKELEISKMELRLLKQQIRPHFVFNSLQIIRSLIQIDPGKAARCLDDFSDYLRANLEVLKSDKLVDFDTELENVEAYVSLALADESKGINVIYDIKDRLFKLPPLSIEPLVENAILQSIAGGKTVTLSTTSDDNSYIVVVKDDGVGFDTGGTKQEKERRGIGVENVRARIEKQCNGTVDIKSGSDGTVITVRIPKEQGDTN